MFVYESFSNNFLYINSCVVMTGTGTALQLFVSGRVHSSRLSDATNSTRQGRYAAAMRAETSNLFSFLFSW